MSDYSINSISNARPAEAGVNASRPAPGAPADTAAKFMPPGSVEAAAKPGAHAPADPVVAKQEAAAAQEKAAPKAALPVSKGGDVAVRFRIDRQTNDITVFIVDRVSKRVLRSIPSEEVGKLQAGDLFELTG